MGFDSYLQDNGFSVGTKLSPEQARLLYGAYQSGTGLSAGSIVAQSRQQRQAEPQGGGMGGMGSMMGGKGGGGSWGGAVGGALSGAAAGHMNHQNDPNMRNKKDGFGTKYRDNRAEVGGAVLGGVMGYYGLGGLAGPAVTAAHPVMEPTTRWLINTGDSFGGAGGALMMDPIGTVASGKYSGEELALGALMGPAAKWFGII
jgi:hypothetical protein